MHLVRLPDAAPYVPAQHTGVRAYRLQGAAAPFCSVGISYYAPDGRADMAAGPQGKIYVVLSGRDIDHDRTRPDHRDAVLRQLRHCGG